MTYILEPQNAQQKRENRGGPDAAARNPSQCQRLARAQPLAAGPGQAAAKVYRLQSENAP